jgi:uncharacterized membrane protein
MNNIEKAVHADKSIVVDVPVRIAYDQWTRFETFPEFMEGVESVAQLDDERVHWKAKIGGVTREWDAEILENVVDQQIAWRSISGATNDGTVTFTSDPDNPMSTEIRLRLDFEPAGAVEKTGDVLGFVERRAKGDLVRFKHFIEARGTQIRDEEGEMSPTREEQVG